MFLLQQHTPRITAVVVITINNYDNIHSAVIMARPLQEFTRFIE